MDNKICFQKYMKYKNRYFEIKNKDINIIYIGGGNCKIANTNQFQFKFNENGKIAKYKIYLTYLTDLTNNKTNLTLYKDSTKIESIDVQDKINIYLAICIVFSMIQEIYSVNIFMQIKNVDGTNERFEIINRHDNSSSDDINNNSKVNFRHLNSFVPYFKKIFSCSEEDIFKDFEDVEDYEGIENIKDKIEKTILNSISIFNTQIKNIYGTKNPFKEPTTDSTGNVSENIPKAIAKISEVKVADADKIAQETTKIVETADSDDKKKQQKQTEEEAKKITRIAENKTEKKLEEKQIDEKIKRKEKKQAEVKTADSDDKKTNNFIIGKLSYMYKMPNP